MAVASAIENDATQCRTDAPIWRAPRDGKNRCSSGQRHRQRHQARCTSRFRGLDPFRVPAARPCWGQCGRWGTPT